MLCAVWYLRLYLPHFKRPVKDQIVSYYVLQHKTLQLKEGVLSCPHDCICLFSVQDGESSKLCGELFFSLCYYYSCVFQFMTSQLLVIIHPPPSSEYPPILFFLPVKTSKPADTCTHLCVCTLCAQLLGR